jgi:hypothetical protein
VLLQMLHGLHRQATEIDHGHNGTGDCEQNHTAATKQVAVISVPPGLQSLWLLGCCVYVTATEISTTCGKNART